MKCKFPPRLSISISAVLVLLVVPLSGAGAGASPEGDDGDTPSRTSVQRFVAEGVAIELAVTPATDGEEASGALVAGENAHVQLTIKDHATGTPLTGLAPAAWMDPRQGDQSPDGELCKTMIESFLVGSLSARAEVDLNIYYVVTLNDDATLSVVDPLFGYGGTKLLAMVFLESPGEDWVLSGDQNRLYVSMPQSGKVAVVDTRSWKVLANVAVGSSPGRLALQPDGRYLWVATGREDGERVSGVAALDTVHSALAADLTTGRGPHEIAITDDDRFAFVTNAGSGTLSVIDVQRLTKIRDVEVGSRPVSVVYSSFSNAIYVTDETDGTIVAVDGTTHEIIARTEMEPGLGRIRLAPGQRFALVVNPERHLVHVLDTSTQRVVKTADVRDVLGESPHEVAFSEYLAYIRSLDSEHILMLPLDRAGGDSPPSLADFPGGQTSLGRASHLSLADTIVPTPEGNAVLVANPVDKMVYYYREGMAAPMGSFQTYGREPRGVLVVERNLKESAPGVYETTARLTSAGTLDVPFFLDSPRVLHCFEVTVATSPTGKRHDERRRLAITPLLSSTQVPAGEPFRFRFEVVDTVTDLPRAGLGDVGVLTLLAPGTWQRRQWSESLGGGTYEVAMTLPRPGIYYVFFECPSLHVRYNELPYLILHASNETTASVEGSGG